MHEEQKAAAAVSGGAAGGLVRRIRVVSGAAAHLQLACRIGAGAFAGGKGRGPRQVGDEESKLLLRSPRRVVAARACRTAVTSSIFTCRELTKDSTVVGGVEALKI